MNAQILDDYVSTIQNTTVFATKPGYSIVHKGRCFRMDLVRLPKHTGTCTELRISRFRIDHIDSKFTAILIARLAACCRTYQIKLTVCVHSHKLTTLWQEHGFYPDQENILVYQFD